MAQNWELREAAEEFQQYLSDRIAPLMVAESIAHLLRYPAQVVAAEIQSWVAQQQPSAPGVPVADFLYHAMRKLAVMGEFELLAREGLRDYVKALGPLVLQYCPEEDRALLQQNLDKLGQMVIAITATQVESLRPKVATPAPARPGLQPGADAGLRRLSLFLERLRPEALAGATPAQRGEIASQYMTAAAVQSKSAKELDEHLTVLRELGVDTNTDKVMQALALSMPGWGNLPGGVSAAANEVQAMRKIVSLAEDPTEAAKRFRELVHAAIEQFNAGHLGRAVTMFELAEQLVKDQKVQVSFLEPLRTGGHEYLDHDRLRKNAERVDARAGLRKILEFFTELQPDGLLKALNGEPRRERRHELLALLEVHEGLSRAKAHELLKASVEDTKAQVDPFFQMNLVYLLRVISRSEDVSLEGEVDMVMRTPGRDSPPPLVKQVIAYLAQVRHPNAERALITYLRVFENMLLEPETAVYPPGDIETLLDRTCAALARCGTPRAFRALVDHGLKAEARLGSTFARLAEAGRQDLSGSKDLVDRLTGALKAELPRTFLGMPVKKNDDTIICLIQALSGTPLPEVRELMQEIVQKHPGQKFTEAAGKALTTLTAGKAAETPPGLSGDLELFGLPNVLQTLGQSQLTGVLSLINARGRADATVLFEKGKYRGAQFGAIRDVEAVYQLFEKPFPGTFAFVSRSDVPPWTSASQDDDVMSLILEGVRRHDEFKRAAVLVPDNAALKPSGAAQTPLPDEDEDFATLVWGKASKGRSPVECEADIGIDSYRVRRLLAHWVEEGALQSN